MLNIIQNTIGAIRRVGESVVRAGLKMWLPFTKAEPIEEVLRNTTFDGTQIPSAHNNQVKLPTWWVLRNNDGDNTFSEFTSNGAKLQWDNSIDPNEDYQTYLRAYDTGNVYLPKAANNDILVFDVGKKYKLSYTVYESSANNVAKLESPASILDTSVGRHTLYFTATNEKFTIIRNSSVTAGYVTFSEVSVEEYAQETPDISGNDNNAILKTGKCLVFAGNDSVDTSFPSSKTIKTIAFWIYPTHTSSAEAIFYGGGGTGSTRELRLAGSDSELKSINNNIVMDTYVDGVYRGVTYGGTPAQLELNQWQRVVLTSSTGFSVVNDTFNIGDGLYAADGRFKMSDLQVYGAEFTTDDIAYDYANPQKLVTDNASSNVTLNDLHAWWHMSEGDGTIAFDSAPLDWERVN